MHKYLFIKHTKAMKKLTYLAVAAVALGVASCNNSKPGYVITGTVEGASDGDTVFIQERVSRQFNKLDTAIIANGTFTFEGVQDSAVNRYITYSNIKYIDNQLVTVIKIQMICKCKYKTI